MAQTKPFTIRRAPALRRAFYILDHGLEKNVSVDNSEKIDLIGRQLFGDLWDLRRIEPEKQST
jgi:hypothetical protein